MWHIRNNLVVNKGLEIQSFALTVEALRWIATLLLSLISIKLW